MLTNFQSAFKIALSYAFLFYFPFLPMAYSFSELNAMEKAVVASLLGICYVGIYATLDVFLKVKLEFTTYVIVTLLILFFSSYVFFKSKQ